MDLHLIPRAHASDVERAAVDAVVDDAANGHVPLTTERSTANRLARGGGAARSRRHLLLPSLHALQDSVGFISEGGLNYVCQRISVAPADAYGVASFYALFS